MANWGLLWAGVPVAVVGVGLFVVGFVLRRQALVLVGTVLAAVGVLAGVAGWLTVADPRSGLSEALKTGGIAAAAVVALYGLWLNDRRRQVEESRQRTDSDRLAHERFARAVELLGNEADQVRVGAMHALVGLARDVPPHTQTVLDVLCSYLRRPFHHPAYQNGPDPNTTDPEREPGGLDEALAELDRERQVRLTAQRLIAELLPPRGSGPDYDLDLTGATLDFMNLSDRRVGVLLARRALCYGITRMIRMEALGSVLFTGARFFGRVDLQSAVFTAGTSLHGVAFDVRANLTGASFGGEFADLQVHRLVDVDATGTTVDAAGRVKLAEGWRTEPLPGGGTMAALVPPAPSP